MTPSLGFYLFLQTSKYGQPLTEADMGVILKINNITGNTTLNTEPGPIYLNQSIAKYFTGITRLTERFVDYNLVFIGAMAVHPIMDTGKENGLCKYSMIIFYYFMNLHLGSDLTV